MQIEIRIDSAYAEPKLIVLTAQMTDELREMLKSWSQETQVISGSRNETIELIDPESIVRVYAAAGKVFAVTEEGEFMLRQRLYEMEARLDPRRFVRISNSELINLKKVKCFDLNFVGTICVRLTDGTTTYVSRRYVPKIKKLLGMR